VLFRSPGHDRELQKEFEAARIGLGVEAERVQQLGAGWSLDDALDLAAEQVGSA